MKSTLRSLATIMGLWAALATLAAGPGPTSASPTSTPATAASHPASAPAEFLPGVRLNLKEGYIDLEAKVVLREGEWLELLACAPGTKEHESVFAIKAKPSSIHAALLALGQEAGSPMVSKWEGEERKVTPAKGPRVAVSVLWDDHGKLIEHPANDFIVDQKAKKPLADNVWVFAGSKELPTDDQKTIYAADIDGVILSLVNFGNDVLARVTDLTNDTDQAKWGPATETIPALRTKVVIRLKPLDKPTTTRKNE